jgi:hypothetical protein
MQSDKTRPYAAGRKCEDFPRLEKLPRLARSALMPGEWVAWVALAVALAAWAAVIAKV